MEPILSVKGLLLDMDGLLLDTERVSESCWAEAERETGFRMPEGFYFSLVGQSIGHRQRLVEVMDPACDIDAFLEVANRIYHSAILENPVPVKPGAAAFLEFLADSGVPRCLATSTGTELCRHKLQAAGLLQWLPLRVCGDQVDHSKPAPDIYLEAARRLNHPAGELLVLEDSENGLRAGMAAGCKVAHVPDIGPVRLDVQLRVDRVFRGLAEVKAAFERGEVRLV